MEKYETAMRRFWAGTVDGIVFIPLGLLNGWILGEPRPAPVLIGWLLISHPAYWLYSVLMHGFYGQTLGKRALDVTVLDASEKPISMRQAFIRDSVFIVINMVSLIVSIYFVLRGRPLYDVSDSQPITILAIASFLWFVAEILTCLTNKKRRAVHDFISGTVVVKTEYILLDEEGHNTEFTTPHTEEKVSYPNS